jgi:hypothetical protein
MRWWAGWATPTAPALLGNTVVWKPSPTQELAAHLTMGLLAEACLPPGVINLVTGDDRAVSEVALADPELAGIHFTGGKDFALAHPCADPAAQDRARPGSVEYQPSSRVLSNTSGTEGVVGHRFSRTNR